MKHLYSFYAKQTSRFTALWLSFIFIALISLNNLYGATKTASTGNWNTAGTWSPSGVPATTDDIVIPTGVSVTLDVNYTLDAGHTFTINGNGVVTINKAQTLTINGTIIFNGTSANSITNATGNNGNKSHFTLGGAATLKTANTSGVTGASCSIEASNNIAITLPSTANYEFNGVAQSTTGLPSTVNNLTLSGTGVKQFGSSRLINGTLSMEGTAIATITGSPSNFTYGPNATLQYNKPAAYTATSTEWVTPFTAAGGIVIKNTGAITTPGPVQIGNNSNVPLDINSGATLIVGANLLTLHGDFINAGTLTGGSGGVTIAGTTASSLSGSGSTVMNNLTIAKTDATVISTLSNLTTDKLTVTSGTFANNGTTSLSGDFVNNGTYTSTGDFTFSGTTPATLSGSGSTNIGNLTVNNTGGVTSHLGLLTTNDFSIATGSTFTVDAQKDVTVNGELSGNIILKSTEAGTASLITKGTVADAIINVERFIGGDSWAWHFLSSPVEAQAISPEFVPTLSGSSEDFYSWSEQDQLWINFKNTSTFPTWEDRNGNTGIFKPGQGYLVAYMANTTKTFVGKPNSFNITYSLSKSGSGTNQYYNLVGNPYPSSIDWNVPDDVSGWDRSKLDGDLLPYKYFWVMSGPTGNYGDYSILSGGTNGVTRYISSGQGFIVKAGTAGNFTMGDGIKVHSTQPFLKKEKINEEVLRLKLSCDANTYSDEAIVAFNNSAPDAGAEKFNSIYTRAPELWSVKNGNKYSINFMGDIHSAEIVPLSVKAGAAGTYTLTASQVESFNGNSAISLEDRATGTFTYLGTTPSYTFQVSAPATLTDRFFLHFMDVTGVAKPDAARNFNMYSTDGVLNIQSLQQLGGKIAVVDMLGRTVATGRVEAGATTRIDMHGNMGVYIVSVLTGKGISNTKVVVK